MNKLIEESAKFLNKSSQWNRSQNSLIREDICNLDEYNDIEKQLYSIMEKYNLTESELVDLIDEAYTWDDAKKKAADVWGKIKEVGKGLVQKAKVKWKEFRTPNPTQSSDSAKQPNVPETPKPADGQNVPAVPTQERPKVPQSAARDSGIDPKVDIFGGEKGVASGLKALSTPLPSSVDLMRAKADRLEKMGDTARAATYRKVAADRETQ